MNYVLSEHAARKVARLISSSVVGQTRRVRPNAAGGGHGSPFHFGVSVEGGEESYTATIQGGAVQVGGYTVFVEGGTADVSGDDVLICVKIALADMGGTIEAISGNDALRSAQADMRYIIFPLYRFAAGRKTVDYRPLPCAGVWESI